MARSKDIPDIQKDLHHIIIYIYDNTKKAIIIGSGIGGLATACILGKAGYSVEVFEKNEQLGGRLSVIEQDGFRFDMGPSWYLMPDVFEHFFKLIGEKVEDHLNLIPLAPSYRIFFKDEVIPNMQTTPDGSTSIIDMYADIEKNSCNIGPNRTRSW